jgi:hypothetical protein
MALMLWCCLLADVQRRIHSWFMAVIFRIFSSKLEYDRVDGVNKTTPFFFFYITLKNSNVVGQKRRLSHSLIDSE